MPRVRATRRGAKAGLVGVLAAAGLAFGGAPAATAQSERGPVTEKSGYREYVALGDSWTADVVILNEDGFPATEHAPLGCAQSHRNYPRLVAKAIGVRTFRDASCGAATTRHFRKPQTDLPIGPENPPQFDRLTRRTDLVTIGIGGNDAGIADAGLKCLNLLPFPNPLPGLETVLPGLTIPVLGFDVPPLGGCKATYKVDGVDRLGQAIKRSQPKVVRALRQIQRISPHARVLVVDYPRVIPDHACYPQVPATDEDMRYIHNKFAQLNRMLKRAARKGGAELVSTAARSRGHHLCTGPRNRHAETLGVSVNDLALGFPAHPNSAGARAQAASVLDYLRRKPLR